MRSFTKKNTKSNLHLILRRKENHRQCQTEQWDGQVGNGHFSQLEPVFRSEVSTFFHRNMWQISGQ